MVLHWLKLILGHLGPSWRHLGPSWRHLGPSWRHIGSSWAILAPSRKIAKNLIKPMVFSLFWRRLGSQNHPQHKPDSTWNGKRCLLFCFLKEASWNGLDLFWIARLPTAPERSARFARCARSLAALAWPCWDIDLVSLFFKAFWLPRWSTYKYGFELDFHSNLAPC